MQVAFFSFHRFDREPFERANLDHGHAIEFFGARLNAGSAHLAQGYPAVCAFVNDCLDAEVLERLQAGGTRLIALRSAGFNHVDRAAARRLGLEVARVPAYSPYAVAEHTVGLLLSLNRKIHRAYARTREHNFRLDGLLGFDLYGKTVGLIGTGKIGAGVARIMLGFGCRVLAYDPAPGELAGVEFVSLETVLRESRVVSLHCPLTPDTHHLLNAERLSWLQPGALLINTSRGALLETRAVLEALKSGRLGGLAVDVYEEEEGVFFEDLSDRIMDDDTLARLLTFPNVLVTGHQGFFTAEALDNIARTTLDSLTAFEREGRAPETCRVSI